MINAAFRNKSSASFVLSRCLLAISRDQSQAASSLVANSTFVPAFDLLRRLQRRRSIASDSFDSRRGSARAPPSTPEQLARVASDAASDVAAVVNQLNSELESFFGMGLPSGPTGGSSSTGSTSGGFVSSLSSSPRPRPSARKHQASSDSPHLTHVDTSTGAASMVDVGLKQETRRTAIARGRVVLGNRAAFEAVERNAVAKGDVLSLARVAGILGAKAVPSLIPLCHTVMIDKVKVSASLDESNNSIELEAEATATGKTGVEMEALAAVSSAALTVYDMTKAMSKESTIEAVRLVSKRGGKSGDWWREGEEGGEQVLMEEEREKKKRARNEKLARFLRFPPPSSALL